MRRTEGRLALCMTFAALLFPLSACGEEDPVTPTGDQGMPTGDQGTPTSQVTWNAIYQSTTFRMCADCHAPGAPGFVQGTEATQNWSTADTAFSSLMGNASGLEGNFAGCNGVPLVGATASTSLLVAALDADVRANFSLPAFPDCTADAIADQTLHVGAVSPALLQNLKDFIDEGGFR